MSAEQYSPLFENSQRPCDLCDLAQIIRLCLPHLKNLLGIEESLRTPGIQLEKHQYPPGHHGDGAVDDREGLDVLEGDFCEEGGKKDQLERDCVGPDLDGRMYDPSQGIV